MRTYLSLAILCSAALAPASIAQTGEAGQPAPLAAKLLGTWRLVSVETIRPNGEVIYPFYGKHPEGLLIYDRSGWMSVQIVSDPKPSVPTASSRESVVASAAADKAAALDGYYAYCGTWTADAKASTVTHHIEHSIYPGERKSDGVRHVTLKGNRLTLVAKAHEMGEAHDRKLVWERIPPAPQ